MEISKLIISHRGNMNGRHTASNGENHPNSIHSAFDAGYACEFDVRYIEGEFWLGHDKPQYKVELDFFNNDKMYVHCKNIEALYHLKDKEHIHAFYHSNEDLVLMTNSKYLWTSPEKYILLTPHSIAVLPELVDNWPYLDICAGICSDFPKNYI